MATLLVANPSGDPWRKALPEAGVLKIGRKPDNDMVIDDPHVSSYHAEVWFDEAQQQHRIKDLKSHNGTRVNGERLDDDVAVKVGDSIIFGILEATLLLDREVRSLSPKRLVPQSIAPSADNVAEAQSTQVVASMLEAAKRFGQINSGGDKTNGGERINGRTDSVPHANGAESGRIDAVCKDVIKRLDLIDDLLDRYRTTKKDDEVVSDLTLIKQSFQDMLKIYEVEAYSFDPETEINLEMRKKIKVVETVKEPQAPDGTPSNRIVQTLHEGYVRKLEGSKPVILRKALVSMRNQLAH